jgi:hypothetical protein
MIDDQPLESARPSFISDIPRLRIDALESALSESEKKLSVLLSSLFPSISSYSSAIDKETTRLSIDDFLALLLTEKIDGEGAAVETLKTADNIEDKNSADLPWTTETAREFKLIKIDEGVRISYSSINSDTASPKANDCVGVDSAVDGEEHLYESLHSFNVLEMDRPTETILPSHHLVAEAHYHLSVDVNDHSDGVIYSVVTHDLETDTDMYSLDFESFVAFQSLAVPQKLIKARVDFFCGIFHILNNVIAPGYAQSAC